jgi:starvation-inducible DNA-binding protein
MDTQVVEKSYDKLGFNKDEAGELVEALNLLLANYAVEYQKIRNFHWNVVGSDFFDVHEKLEAEYLYAAASIDEIAERVRMLGFRPLSTLAEFLEFSDIEETTETPGSDEIMKAVVEDYETLLSFMIDVADLAVEYGDLGTESMMRTMIQTLEKKHWMFSAFLSRK